MSHRDDRFARNAWRGAMQLLARYHDWEVEGVENIPSDGGAVITCTHSLASYDLFIMGCASRDLLGRQAYIVGDDLMFRFASEETLHELGYVPGGRERIVDMLRNGQLVGIAPGGMKESLRPYPDRYSFDWSGRRGFVWVALLAGVPIIPAVCPSSNDIFTVYPSRLTEWAYRRLKMPLPIFRGVGPTVIPRPVKLVSVIGAPIHPDVAPDRVEERDVERMHTRVVEATRSLMADVLRKRDGNAATQPVARRSTEEGSLHAGR